MISDLIDLHVVSMLTGRPLLFQGAVLQGQWGIHPSKRACLMQRCWSSLTGPSLLSSTGFQRLPRQETVFDWEVFLGCPEVSSWIMELLIWSSSLRSQDIKKFHGPDHLVNFIYIASSYNDLPNGVQSLIGLLKVVSGLERCLGGLFLFPEMAVDLLQFFNSRKNSYWWSLATGNKRVTNSWLVNRAE